MIVNLLWRDRKCQTSELASECHGRPGDRCVLKKDFKPLPAFELPLFARTEKKRTP